MTTLREIQLQCPVCANRFTSKAVLTTDSVSGRRTDFHERSSGIQPLPYLVHLCQRCGYAGTEQEFSEESDASPMLQRHIWNELTPRLTDETPAASEKYEFAAKVAIWHGMEPRRVGELWLRAAWCSVDEGDTEAERYFRRFAAWTFEEALSTYDGVAREERSVLTYLIGELWRRIGDDVLAREWFDRVPDEITAPETQEWILEESKRQRDDPREWFT